MNSKNDTIQPAAYQLIPLSKILNNKLKAVFIADDVGLGKTISASYILQFFSSLHNKPALVICPPNLLNKWIFELKSKFNIKSLPIRSQEDLETAKKEWRDFNSENKSRIYVMSNSLLQSKLQDIKLSVIVFDEIHNYRNQKTKLYKGAITFSLNARYRIGLSATPINNSLQDLSSELSILLPEYEWCVIDSVVTDLWHRKPQELSLPLVTRFKKKELGFHFAKRKLTNLMITYPPSYSEKVRQLITLRMQSAKKERFFEAVTYFRLAASSPFAFSKSFHLTTNILDNDPKIDSLTQNLNSMKFSNILIFCAFQETVNYLYEKLENWNIFCLTGKTPMIEREGIIQDFKDTPNSILLLTAIGSEGLDLQFCSKIINYDLHWNPMVLEQRAGRIDRKGQLNEEIEIINFQVLGSIDERVLSVLQKKLNLTFKSVFSTDPLISKAQQRNHCVLSDNNSTEKELVNGKRFIKSMSLINSIPEGDYKVLPFINLKFCTPNVLTEIANQGISEPIWIKDNKISNQWTNTIASESTKLKELLEYYK